MKKTWTILLICAMLTGMLLSCAGKDTETKPADGASVGTESAVESETEPETEPVYPTYTDTFDGAECNMLYFDAVEFCGWSKIPCDINEPELTGDALSDAVFTRNRKLEEMYQVKFTGEGYKDMSKCSLIEKQVLAGDTQYDLVFPAWNTMYSFVTSHSVTDLTGLFDFSMPWFDAKSRDAFTIGGKTYAVISDATYMDKLLSMAILFNQQMVTDYNLGDIYGMVLDGTWTFEEMVKMCEAVSEDVDGNGVYDRNDRFGLINQDDGIYELYNGGGLYFCKIGDDGVPVIADDSELAVSVLQKILTLMNNERLFFNRGKQGLSTVEICNMFAEGRGLFILRQIQAAFELRDMETDFGIIPVPKMYEGQADYHTSIGYTVATTQCIPAVVKNTHMSVVILDTMAAESYYSVNSVLYDTILGQKLARDEVSRENLEIIFANRFYDPGCVYNFGSIASDWMANVGKGPEQVASLLEKNQPKIEKAIEKFMTALTEEE